MDKYRQNYVKTYILVNIPNKHSRLYLKGLVPFRYFTRTASQDTVGKSPFSPITEPFFITQWNCMAIGLCSKSKTNQWQGSRAEQVYGDEACQSPPKCAGHLAIKGIISHPQFYSPSEKAAPALLQLIAALKQPPFSICKQLFQQIPCRHPASSKSYFLRTNFLEQISVALLQMSCHSWDSGHSDAGHGCWAFQCSLRSGRRAWFRVVYRCEEPTRSSQDEWFLPRFLPHSSQKFMTS